MERMRRWLPDMTADEVAAAGACPVLLPVGSLEQHGPHLPLDTDSAIAEALALALAEAVGAMVAPSLRYGYRSQPASGGGEFFTATTSLSGAALCTATYDIVCAFARHGYREFALINGHFENTAFIVEAATLAVQRHPELRVVSVNWWEQASAETLEEIFAGGFPGWEAEHAGVVETSLMMHIDPSRVRADLIDDRVAETRPPTYTVLPERAGLVDPSGVLRTARGSSAEIGEQVWRHVTAACEEILRAELGSGSADV
jgi:creatinine amidohydrolase